IKNVANRFVATLLEFNPDATEQLDLRSKHIANVENLGDQARKKTSQLIHQMKELFNSLEKKFNDPSWMSGNLNALASMAETLDPSRCNLKETRISRFLEHIPGITTALRRYFARFESKRNDIELLIRHLNRLVAQVGKDNDTMILQKNTLQDHCRTLAKAIYLGTLIHVNLGKALLRDIPLDDPRYVFIEKEICLRLRGRLKNLGLQRELNMACFVAITIILENNRELHRGLETAKHALLSAFNQGVVTAQSLIRQQLTPMPLTDPSEPGMVSEDYASPPNLKTLSDSLGLIPSACQAVQAFVTEAEPHIRSALSDLPQRHKLTEDSFRKMRLTRVDILSEELL
ncbi:MAG: toxic anion resistance protein, partial [Desulfobacteraceae bacterium]|nr:toxic anion resistance protein [Desulfobacteraceae bacterium]